MSKGQKAKASKQVKDPSRLVLDEVDEASDSHQEWGKIKNFFGIRSTQVIVLNLFLFTILVTSATLAYEMYIVDRFVPKTQIGDTDVSFMTKPDAFRKISNQINNRTKTPLNFQFQNNHYTLDIASTNPNVNYSKALEQAYAIGHQGTVFQKLAQQVKTSIYGYYVMPELVTNANYQIETIAKQVDQQPQDATIWLDDKNKIHIKEGVVGATLNKKDLDNQISNYLILGVVPKQLPINNTDPSFTITEAEMAKDALESIQAEPIKLVFKNQSWEIDVPTLFYLLNIGKSKIDDDQNNSTLLDPKKIDTYLTDVALKIDRPVEEPLFKFDSNSKKVAEFRPAQLGQQLDVQETANLITQAVTGQIGHQIILPVQEVQPKIPTSQINDLGIQELIGHGTSTFVGSIENRVYNVGFTANKINGVLIPPGEIFSFNKTVGEISGATGFKQAYVIKSGRTVLDDGGGVCQISTTLFRAALNAGLPITDRTAHAYRVGYYEQGFPAGIDATIFHPTVDFKFKNDTAAYILIQAQAHGTSLTIDLYGTPDGRSVELTTPVVTDQTPPPPELRQDDPTLPRGQVKQVDWAAWGARVSFKRTVTRNGETIAQETWRSNYKPWQAVYLVGTKD